MYNIEKTANNYNNYLIDLLWNNKVKLFSFIVVTVIAFVNIPHLNNLQDHLDKKANHEGQYVNAKQIGERRNDFTVILDVRTPEEYAQGHVSGSVNVEYKDILASQDGKVLNTYNVNPDSVILVYCKSGRRASLARDHLINQLHFDSQKVFLTGETYETIEKLIND